MSCCLSWWFPRRGSEREVIWRLSTEKKGPLFLFWGEYDFLLAYQSFSYCASALYNSGNQHYSWCLTGETNTESYVNMLNSGESVALSPLGHSGSNLPPRVIGSTRAGVVPCEMGLDPAWSSQGGVTTRIPWGSSQDKPIENPKRQDFGSHLIKGKTGKTLLLDQQSKQSRAVGFSTAKSGGLLC